MRQLIFEESRMLHAAGRLLLLALVACAPVPGTDGTDTDTTTDPDALGQSGRLYDVPMSLVWGWNTTDSTDGVCVDLKIATNGADVRSWSLDVVTDQPITDLYYVQGADVRATDTGFTVAPSVTPELTDGEEVLARFCSRPGVRPVSMTASVSYVDSPDTDPPATPDPYDMLLDVPKEFGLQFAEEGEENGGRCLRFDVINLTNVPVIDWALEVTMVEDVARTSSEGLWFYEGRTATQLIVLPDYDSRTIQPFDAETGRVCLSPFSVPIAIRAGEAPAP
jgi:hypothetical protein